MKAGVLWAGTDDGNVQISRDGGKTWNNVFNHIPGVQKGAYVSRIEPSYKEEGTAYLTFDNHRSADYTVYIYMTKNYGDSWSKITNGINQEAGTVHVIREDPANSNLTVRRHGIRAVRFVQPRGELGAAAEWSADRAGVRLADSPSRS